LHGGEHDLPAQEGLLTLEELDRLCSVFVEKGVKKLRLTGGEPLVRKNIMSLFEPVTASRVRRAGRTDADHQRLAAERYASRACRHGVRASMCRSTRWMRTSSRHHPLGRPEQGSDGLKAAQEAGLKSRSTVALKNFNEHEIPDDRMGHGQGMDLTLIETMPLGEIEEDRTDQYLPLSLLRANPGQQFTLEDIPYKTGGPARYVEVKETGGGSASSPR
jgi:cyclic pyranopterin phosphate synthase